MISYKQVSVSDIQVKNPALTLKESEIERITEYLSISRTAFPPLVVRRLGSRLSCHTYELLQGYQQYCAAQKAKLDRINALILEENDTLEIETAILNQIQSNSPISEVTEEQTTGSSAFDSPASNANADIIKILLEQNQQILEQHKIICQSLEEMKTALAKINDRIDSLPPSQDQNQLELKVRLLNEGTEAQIEEWFKKAKVNKDKNSLPPSQVSLPTPTATPSTFSEDQNQLELKVRLLNEGTEAQIEERFKKAKVNKDKNSLPPSQVSLPTPTATPSTFSEDQNQLELKVRLLNEGTEAQIEEWFKKARVHKKTRESHLKKILNYRRQNPFKSLEDLTSCLNIKPGSLEKLKSCPIPPSFSP
ncbi:hypothetical protein D3A95_13290 [Thermosynechococcus sichuanensis E542]|uniref:Uncharacterized protein n=1 Tax=Thermosynechococcus sichuanensis E542 TaxID=2016101 RepID=A0A7D6EW32_9CYAN|nr:hypothetical protein [Thermosynechococcus vestitus]QLL29328.1 hypothetical protein D3A95_13290 [Thermosynechococcus vestitus E542]